MTRKKVKLAFITNDSARKATYKKRKNGLLKKMSELSTLCGIEACAIVFSPYDSQPELWPKAMGVQRVIDRFKQMPEMEQRKKVVNQEIFIKQRISKVKEQLAKQLKDNRVKEITELMHQSLTWTRLQNVVLADLNNLRWLIDQKLKEIYKKMEAINKTAPHLQAAPPLLQLKLPVLEITSETLPRGMLEQEQKSRSQWFAEWMNNKPSTYMGFSHADDIM